jgi:hypothetical protein
MDSSTLFETPFAGPAAAKPADAGPWMVRFVALRCYTASSCLNNSHVGTVPIGELRTQIMRGSLLAPITAVPASVVVVWDFSKSKNNVKWDLAA